VCVYVCVCVLYYIYTYLILYRERERDRERERPDTSSPDIVYINIIYHIYYIYYICRERERERERPDISWQHPNSTQYLRGSWDRAHRSGRSHGHLGGKKKQENISKIIESCHRAH
jgi:hypothetical protein